MKQLKNGLKLTPVELKKFVALKLDILKTRFQEIDKKKTTLSSFEIKGKGEKIVITKSAKKNKLPNHNGICFYKEPKVNAGIDLGNLPQYNKKALSHTGEEVPFLKTYSDFNPDNQEMNLACMTGRFDNTVFTADKRVLGIGYNEICGTYYETITIPEGINIPDNSLVNFKVRLKISQQTEAGVYKLLPGNSGVRILDIVGVIGTVYLLISYKDPQTNQEIKVGRTNTFLDKFITADTPLMGHYNDVVPISVSMPIIKDRFGRLPKLTVTTVINVATYCGKNFSLNDGTESTKQYAVIDLRKFHATTPKISPDTSRLGAGGVKLQWYQLCFPSASE